MSTRQPRDVARRPTIVAYGGGGHERLMPLLASLAATGSDSRSQSAVDDQAAENKPTVPEPIAEDGEPEEWRSSDEYDTDLEQTGGNDGTNRRSPGQSRKKHALTGEEGVEEAATVRVDWGETAYGEACDRLGITRVQRVVTGLSTSAINLKYRSLGPRGAKALAAALNNNSRVETLDVEENGLGGEGAVYIADMLRENSFITAVNIAKNNIGSEGAMAFGELLQFDNEIQYLDLSENGLRDCDAEPLACGIERNERIIYLNLSHNEFAEEGATSLGRAIGTNNSIERLDLSWNQMRRKGAVMICTGLKRNYCVTSVNLSWNGFDYEGSLAVGEMLRGNKYLREVDVSNNRINWEGAILIAKGLKENDTLEILYMGGNPLTMTGVLDILEAVDNSSSVVTYIGFDGIPVNRKIMYMMESIQKHREFTMSHGGLLESEDILGRRMVLRWDPLKLLVQFLTDKNIRPVDLFRTFDKDKQFRVTREQFIQGLKKAKVPLDDYEMEKVLFRLDTGKEGKISYQRLMKGVKEQLRMNRAEEKQRMLEEKNTNDENRKLIKMAGLVTGAGAGGGKVSFAGSGSSSPRRPGTSSSSDGDDDDGETAIQHPVGNGSHGSPQRTSNLTQVNVQAHQSTAARGGVSPTPRRHQGVPSSQSHHGDPSTGRIGESKAATSISGHHVGGASKSSLTSHATGSRTSVATASQHVTSGAGHDVRGTDSVAGGEGSGVGSEHEPIRVVEVTRKQQRVAAGTPGAAAKTSVNKVREDDIVEGGSERNGDELDSVQRSTAETGKKGTDTSKKTMNGKRSKKRDTMASTDVSDAKSDSTVKTSKNSVVNADLKD